MDFSDLLESGLISPEEEAQLSAAGGIDTSREDLQRQLAQADALRKQHLGQGHISALGGAFGGLADIINAQKANQKEDMARQQMAGLNGQQQQQQMLLASVLGRAGKRRQQVQGDSLASSWQGYPSQPDGSTGIVEDGDK